MSIENELHKLQQIKASARLHYRIRELTHSLPDKHKGFYFPLFALQGGLVVGVLLLLTIVGSGIMLAGNSKPGNPLYPVKTAIERITKPKPQIQEPQITAIKITPTATPTPHVTKAEDSPRPTFSIKRWGDDGEEENNLRNSFEKLKQFLENKLQRHKAFEDSKEDN